MYCVQFGLRECVLSFDCNMLLTVFDWPQTVTLQTGILLLKKFSAEDMYFGSFILMIRGP